MVSGVAVNLEKEEILLGENLVPSKPPGFYGLFGGRIEENESSEEALCREWLEEIGQPKIEFVNGVTIQRSGPEGEYPHYFYRVRVLRTGMKKEQTPNEIGPPEWIPFSKITSREIKVFPSHLRGIAAILSRMAKKNIKAGFLVREIERLLNNK